MTMSKAQFRVLMLLTVVSGLVGGALSDWLFRGLPARAAAPQVIEAQEFRLVDSDGKKQAALQFDKMLGGPELCLYDATGQERAGLSLIGGNHPYLAINDATGQQRVGLTLWEDGGPGLGLWDAMGQLRVALGIQEDGRPGLRLKDATGQQRVGLGLGIEEGNPVLSLWDAAGETRAQLRLTPDDSPTLGLWDAAGKSRARLGLEDGRPGMTLWDAAGNARAIVGCFETVIIRSGVKRKHSESTITLLNDGNEVLWQAP